MGPCAVRARDTAARQECAGGHDHEAVDGERADEVDDGFLAVVGEQAGQVPVRHERGDTSDWEQTGPAQEVPAPARGQAVRARISTAMNRNTGQTTAPTTAPGSGAQPAGAPWGGRNEWATFAAMETAPPPIAPVYAQPLPGCLIRVTTGPPGRVEQRQRAVDRRGAEAARSAARFARASLAVVQVRELVRREPVKARAVFVAAPAKQRPNDGVGGAVGAPGRIAEVAGRAG